MSRSQKSVVNFRISQNGVEIAVWRNVRMMILSNMSGTVGNVACFPELRFLDHADSRRAVDLTTRNYRGPVSVEVLSATTGQCIHVIAVADRQDVASHPRGKVAYAR